MRLEGELGHGGTRKFWNSAICGEVLAVDPPHRLSYTLGECQSDPAVYVTWELRAREGLTIVRFYIDEPDGYPGSEDDLDIIWLPTLSTLGREPQQPTSYWATYITSPLSHRSPPSGPKHRDRRETSIAIPVGQSLRKARWSGDKRRFSRDVHAPTQSRWQ